MSGQTSQKINKDRALKISRGMRMWPVVVAATALSWACAKTQRSGLEDAPVRPISAKTSEQSRRLRSELKNPLDAKLFANVLSSMGRVVQPVTPETADAPSQLVCTAFHIGDGLVLTSGSCVKDCATLKITWTKSGSASAEGGNETSCAEVVSRSDTDETDYALLKMKEADKVPSDFVRLALNTTVISKNDVVVLGFSDGDNRSIWISSGCSLNAGTGYDGAVEGIDSHDCDVEHGSQGALVFSNKERSPLAVFSKTYQGINVVTSFKKINVPDPVSTPEPTPSPTPEPTPMPTGTP